MKPKATFLHRLAEHLLSLTQGLCQAKKPDIPKTQKRDISANTHNKNRCKVWIKGGGTGTIQVVGSYSFYWASMRQNHQDCDAVKLQKRTITKRVQNGPQARKEDRDKSPSPRSLLKPLASSKSRIPAQLTESAVLGLESWLKG